MMAGNPNWWSMDNGMHNTKPEFAAYGSSSALSSSLLNPSPAADHHYLQPNGQDFPIRSWSQLLMGGSAINNNNDEENWEGQFSSSLKQEENRQLIYGQYNLDDHDDDCNEFIRPNKLVSDSSSWRHHHHHHHRGPVSSPTSCITTLSNNILSFSAGKPQNQKHNQEYHSSECNSTGTGGASKKARVTPQPALKVRKEKLGDRITTLHNLVSPFGKTDTASVLSEANGYIRFLHAQIEALSSPYMRNASAESATHNQHSESQSRSGVKDLRSKGLCLVPTSCTGPIENEMEADYWAPTAFNFSWRQV